VTLMMYVVLVGQDSSAFNRHMSVDSVNSYNSLTSQQTSATDTTDVDRKKRRKNWVRLHRTTALSCSEPRQSLLRVVSGVVITLSGL